MYKRLFMVPGVTPAVAPMSILSPHFYVYLNLREQNLSFFCCKYTKNIIIFIAIKKLEMNGFIEKKEDQHNKKK
jgi:hypothetical protein